MESIKVLLIEDNPQDFRLFKEMIKESRAPVELNWAQQLSTGLANIEEDIFDGLLLDLGLPDSQGIDTFKKIHNQAPQIPIIVLTGLADDGLAIRALREGAQDYLVKGQIDGNLLIRAIHYAIERKLIEKALIESQRSLEAVVETAPSLIVLTDPEGRITMFNRACEELTGYKRDEVLQKTIPELFLLPEWAPVVQKRFADPYAPEVRAPHEHPWLTKSGEQRLIEWRCTVLPFPQDGRPCILGTGNDITERKKMEEALQRSEKEAKELARENTTIAEIGRIISSTLNIEDVYERFAEEVHKLIPFDRIAIHTVNFRENTITPLYVAGVTVQGRQAGDVIPLSGSSTEAVLRARQSLLIQMENKDELIRTFPELLTMFNSGLQSLMSIPLISKDDVIGVFQLQSLKPNAYAETDRRLAEKVGNQIAGAIATAQLFLERQRAEKTLQQIEGQLHQSQKMEAIGQLAGGVAHDFNNLLTIIKGYSQLSLMDLKEGAPLRHNIEEVQRAADHAAGLTRQLLAFSRRQVMEMRVIDLNTLLRDLDKMLRRIIGEDIELVTKLADDLGTIKSDPGQIEQVIMNLVVNAKDAMPQGGKLTLETAEVHGRRHVEVKSGRYVLLSISDTGVGMTPEVRDRVFEPFFTTKEKEKGTGLGLSTAYGIVKQSGGNIRVYSEPGQGATFKIYLPRVDEPLEEVRERMVKEELPRGSETILVVEDEEKVRQLAVRILQKQGYNVLEASHGGNALLLCKRHKRAIHLILTDVVMPGISGPELTKRLAPLHPEMKVIYTSGYTDNAIVRHGTLEEGINFIQKPFTLDGLVRKVREVLT